MVVKVRITLPALIYLGIKTNYADWRGALRVCFVRHCDLALGVAIYSFNKCPAT